MNKTERLYNQMEKLMDTLGIPREIPKGSFYDITDEEKEMNNKKRGGQPGNRERPQARPLLQTSSR